MIPIWKQQEIDKIKDEDLREVINYIHERIDEKNDVSTKYIEKEHKDYRVDMLLEKVKDLENKIMELEKNDSKN